MSMRYYDCLYRHNNLEGGREGGTDGLTHAEEEWKYSLFLKFLQPSLI